MQQGNSNKQEQQVLRAVAQAPGAVPPTGGAPPKLGVALHANANPSVDDLIEGLNLLLRAARQFVPPNVESTLPQLEAAAERTIAELQALEPQLAEDRDGLLEARARAVADDIRRDLLDVIGHGVASLNSAFLRHS